MNTKQRGISMVEVLVTIVIFSVGLLGVASLQMFTLKMNNNADVRTRASLLAGDIVERMRAINDPSQWDDYVMSYDQCAEAITGSASNVISEDRKSWCARVARELPGAQGSVAYSNGAAVVTIQWQEREGRELTDADGKGTGGEWSTSEFALRARLQ
ncbi:MAG: type IV pilus modification protein PilV [Marinobacter sp.]|uniref:type IV pilus modification protein PilV n=1 Tax=Marinobacter sp. TaxID=50741 RepID=UPI00299EDE22|nr:type IV pilus modification protein PilV [Marinobacter sp.]MDX1756229.1 type IV pilus modification protein PilV [Marinobacter sp.]